MMGHGRDIITGVLGFVAACSLIGLPGCGESSDELEGKPLSEVLLRYTPQAGQTLDYKYSMSLDKKLFDRGKWFGEGNEKGTLLFSITTVEHNDEGYRTKFEGRWGDSNVSKETAEVMRDKIEAAQSIDLIISDRYVWGEAGTHNLCFPDQPVGPGDEWTGEIRFRFGDLATVETPVLPMSYRLVKAVESHHGRYCLIECNPATDRIEVPLQFGQLGLRCDTTGTVTAVREDSDARGKIEVGDVLMAINGSKAVTAKDWRVLYERFIEPPDNVGLAVLLTIKRDGQEQDVAVKKSFATVGTMEIKISNATRTVLFDADRGIVVSDRTCPDYSVMCKMAEEFPFTDEYAGAGSFQGQAGRMIGPRTYHNQYTMTLLR